MWILFALLTPALYAVAEIFDEYLTNHKFKSTTSVVFYSSLLNIIFIPVVFLIARPAMPASHLILPLIGVGLTNLLYMYPYYRALQIEDTSVIIAFFSLSRVFTPFLAFLFVSEVLSFYQYIGIAVVVLGNILLALHRRGIKLRFSHAFFLIMLAGFITAIEGVLFKYMFEQGMSWSTAVGGQLIVTTIFSFMLLFSMKVRRNIRDDWGKFTGAFRFFFYDELFTFLAVAAETYAIMIAPVSLVKAVGLTAPLFVLSYTVMVKKRIPKSFHENTNRAVLIKKIPLYLCIIAGVLLIGFFT